MDVVAVALLLTTSLYAGFQWTVRVVVYPQFATVDPAGFPRYERRHQTLVSVAVGPLFAAEAAAVVTAVVTHPGAPTGLVAAAFAGVLAVTWLAAVPAHGRLSRGFDAGIHRRLLAVDAVRLGLALAAVAGAVWFALTR